MEYSETKSETKTDYSFQNRICLHHLIRKFIIFKDISRVILRHDLRLGVKNNNRGNRLNELHLVIYSNRNGWIGGGDGLTFLIIIDSRLKLNSCNCSETTTNASTLSNIKRFRLSFFLLISAIPFPEIEKVFTDGKVAVILLLYPEMSFLK